MNSVKFAGKSYYQREGLEIQGSDFDAATGEKDYIMVWQRNK